jgi:hypothetical protein
MKASALGILAACFVLPTTAVVAAADSPLVVLHRDLPASRHAASGVEDVGTGQWTLMNIGEVPIVAWHFACVHGSADGRETWIGQGSDTVEWTSEATPSPAATTAPIAPGGTVVVDMPVPARRNEISVWACGPTAAVAADLSSWGAPEVLGGIFERRRQSAVEAHRLLEAIRRVREVAAARELDRGAILATLEAALPVGRLGAYRGEVASAGRPSSTDAILGNLEALERRIGADLRRMSEHLRPEDLEVIEEAGS